MFPYADFEFYTKKAHGKIAQEEFETQVLEASFFLRHITLGKSDRQQSDDLSYAACAIADMYANKKRKLEKGTQKSENTDGYSVNYVVEQKDGESLEDLLSRKSLAIARKYLGATGLLNRKVV